MSFQDRHDIIMEADGLINGDRNAQYGEPSQDFRRTGVLWSVYLSGVLERKAAEYGVELTPQLRMLMGSLVDPWDVAWMQTLLKSSRSTVSPHKRDHYTDAIGYSACGWDCARLPAADPVLDALLDEEERIHRSTTRPPAP